MKHILIFQNNTQNNIFFSNVYQAEDFKILEKGDCIQIESHSLKENESITKNGITYMHIPITQTYSVVSLTDEVFIGRDTKSTIQIEDSLISNIHARIYKQDNAYYLEDLQSTNGVYVNSRRIQTIQLKDKMIFYLVNIRCVFLDSFILIAFPVPNSIPMKKNSIPVNIQEDQFQPLHQFRKEIIELDSFLMDREPVKQKLFQSIGSSVMILFSSLISCLVMYFLYPDQKTQLLSMVLMSGSMSLSFLFYGLYNRKETYKLGIKTKEKNEKLYLNYLETVSKKIEFIQQNNKRQIDAITKNALHPYITDHDIVLYTQFIDGIEFKYHKWNYQQVTNDMVKTIQQWMKDNQIQIQIPVYLEKKSYSIPKDISWAYGLFQKVCLQKKNWKVVWVMDQVDERILSNPICIAKKKRLWIHDMESYYRVLSCIEEYSEVLYIISNRKYDLPDGYKIYLNEKKIQPIEWIPYSFSLDIYRSILHVQQSKTTMNLSKIFKTIQWKNAVNLKVVTGLNDNKQPIYIDFQEGKDGPHGLVAGSTGYGKSEWLSNVLLQLIYQNDPKYFQYILIDFKGGAFGTAFTKFPHFAGMITNLDNDISRFIEYISNFITKRQSILKQFQEEYSNVTAHVDTYNLYHPDTPLSHVFIVVDEFAQLKTQAMELLTNIKELARIGRSLGIHLILSTQKPMGVIDDQIWANSNFQVCLKVLSKQDSKEVIHSDIAYSLMHPGEFIFHSNERMEKGTSFYIHEKRYIDDSPIEIDTNDGVINDCEKISYLDLVYQQIESLHRMQQFIIPPSLEDYVFTNEWLIYEDLKQCRSIPYKVEYGDVFTILTSNSKSVLHSILSNCQSQRIYSLNITGMDDYFDECYFDDSLYWKCIHLQEKVTIVLSGNITFELWKNLFFKKNFKIFIVFNHFKSSWYPYIERINKGCINCENLDEIRAYFNDYSIKKVGRIGILKIKREFYSFVLNERMAQRKENKIILNSDKKGLQIGKDELKQTIYWSRRNPLVICFVQKSVRKKIMELLKSWKKIENLQIVDSYQSSFDVYLCDLSVSKEILQSQEYIQNQYDWDVLWVGKGISEYAYLLHKKIPLNSADMIYWHENEERLLTWNEF